MPFPNIDTQFKPGESGNPAGKPKGTKHITSWIQELLNDEEFECESIDGKKYKGAPLQAIVKVAIMKSIQGDNKWAEWLAKHGYGEKLDITTKGESINVEPDPKLAAEFTAFMKERNV